MVGTCLILDTIKILLRLRYLLHCFSFGFPLLSIVFRYFSKLFPISIKCQSDVNMK
jgi:hypothetical protein